ncbi:hypothetical protein OHV05_10180 [Kitasatospora sp. NBC_00070]|uniref:hypothetical protein n=1 Tax=Kitasatospora sp. NBC_00070 TaxID=2975962 RepID=UPI0032501AEA
MKRDILGWLAMAASIAVTAQGEWALATACGYHPIVAGALPVAIDAYAIRALRAGREVLAAVLAMVATNSAAHLLHGGMLTVSPWLVVAVSAIAPLVLWRVHALAPEASDQPFSRSRENAPEYPAVGSAGPTPPEVPEGPESVGSPGDLTTSLEGAVQAGPSATLGAADPSGAYPIAAMAYPKPVPGGHMAAPERVRLDFMPLPTRARELAAEEPRTRSRVDAEYVPEDAWEAGTEETEDDLAARARAEFADRLTDGKVPPIRDIRSVLAIGQARAQRVQDALRRDLESGVRA